MTVEVRSSNLLCADRAFPWYGSTIISDIQAAITRRKIPSFNKKCDSLNPSERKTSQLGLSWERGEVAPERAISTASGVQPTSSAQSSARTQNRRTDVEPTAWGGQRNSAKKQETQTQSKGYPGQSILTNADRDRKVRKLRGEARVSIEDPSMNDAFEGALLEGC